MTENKDASKGWDRVGGKVLDLSQTPPSKLKTSRTPLPVPYQTDKPPTQSPPKFKSGQTVFNMHDRTGQNSIQCADQHLATAAEWTGFYTITAPPETRSWTYHYKIQPGRHEPGRTTQEEAFLAANHPERGAGWQVVLTKPAGEQGSILEGKIENGVTMYLVRYGINDRKWVSEADIMQSSKVAQW